MRFFFKSKNFFIHFFATKADPSQKAQSGRMPEDAGGALGAAAARTHGRGGRLGAGRVQGAARRAGVVHMRWKVAARGSNEFGNNLQSM